MRLSGGVLEGLFQPERERAHQIDVPEQGALVPFGLQAPLRLLGSLLLLMLADGSEAGVGGGACALALVEAVSGEVSMNAAATALSAVTGDIGAAVELIRAGREGL